MKIYIRDRNPDLIKALQIDLNQFSVDGKSIYRHIIEIEQGEILEKPAEALVSPANSFGYMDGGVDLHYCEKIGWHLQGNLQNYIKQNTFFNEVYIGQAVSIPTDDSKWPWLISAPTMRLPSRIPDYQVFLATRAAMAEAIRLDVGSVLFPGMGTGVGGVEVNKAAHAMLSGMQAAMKADTRII